MDESEFGGLTVCVVGLGLMGGSMAMALRGKVDTLIGVDKDRAVCRKATKQDVVEDADTDLETGVGLADLVILATPVRAIVEILGQIGPWLSEDATVIDLGSVKRPVIEAMDALPAHVRAIGGHPMCGKETSGLDVAEADLFRRHTFVLCQTARTDDDTLRVAEALCDAIGARPYMLDAERHDTVAAKVSHLPALLSAALVGGVMPGGTVDPATGRVASTGFRDTSRLAASDSVMMADILLSNADAIIDSVNEVYAQLDELMAMVQAGDADALRAHLEGIRQARIGWAEEHGFTT
jgi:prephenate dehydrogenase